jgi:RNA polymerase sigma factor for flagellar operon FliA
VAQCTRAAAADITPYDLEESTLGAEPWSAEEDMVNRHDSRSVHRALERLPERLCTVMKLYYFEDLSLREIGETLGVTEARVHQLRAEALTLLRTFYQGSLEVRCAA